MSKYREWMSGQSPEFIKIVHGDTIPTHYKDKDDDGITLEELEKLDNKFVNNIPEE